MQPGCGWWAVATTLYNPVAAVLHEKGLHVAKVFIAWADSKLVMLVLPAPGRRVGRSSTPTCPTLVVWGEQDRSSSIENGRRVAAEINGAKFTVIPRAAHLPQIEQPEAFQRIVQPFLQIAAS